MRLFKSVAPEYSPSKSLQQTIKRTVSAMVGAVAIATVSALPGLADPFRSAEPHTIDDQTEQAFDIMFRDGNYVEARELLATADQDEPLAHAMKASFSFLDQDWDTLKLQAEQTLDAASQLTDSDPLRSHLYTAVGHFLEGAHIFSTEGAVTAIPRGLSKLSQVLSSMKSAESIDSEDPELNLIKGYMDLMIAVSLPRSNPQEAITRLEEYGSPDYLVNRGIAIAYRDLKQHDKALEYVDQALELTPGNPDLRYLKGQILRNKAEDLDEPDQAEEQQQTLRQSVRHLRQAFALRAQMPESLAAELGYEFCRAQDRLRERDRNCRNWTNNQLAATPESASPEPDTSELDTSEPSNSELGIPEPNSPELGTPEPGNAEPSNSVPSTSDSEPSPAESSNAEPTNTAEPETGAETGAETGDVQ